MKIICGLGNPGSKYDGTRHNAGFDFIDEFARKNGFPEFSEKWDALISEKGLGEEKMILIKPQTYMNKSGEPLAKFINFYKLPLSDLFVIYDDVDLALGKIRLKEEGSAGTHNGMKSVIQCLGAQNFNRLRLGVESRGVSSPAGMDISDFVLSRFSDEELTIFKTEIIEALSILEKSLAR
jgi:PTH1 family peptidyl-tRNA hydrolase